MDFKDFTAGSDDEGRRFDRILRIFLKEKSLGEIYKLLRKGLIKLNDKKAAPETHVAKGDKISIAAFLLENTNNAENSKNSGGFTNDNSSAPALDIVFENEHLLIINKPFDRTVHGEKDGLYKDVLAYWNKNCKDVTDSLSFKPGPLHRLDRRTTGLLVFSKSLEGARWFSDCIKNHTVQKGYYALLNGNLTGEVYWEDYIQASEDDELNGFHTVKVISGTDKAQNNGCKAVTIARPLCHGIFKGQAVTLAEVDIKTGRKHQIRAQSSFHGFPLFGDSAYGAPESQGENFYLQAFRLRFPKDNPFNLPEEIKIPLNSYFITQLQCCEIENPGL